MTHIQTPEQQAQPDTVSSMAEVTALLLRGDAFETFLVRVAELATQALPWVESCGISATAHQRATMVATDTVSRGLDQVQFDAQRGPCLEAQITGAAVTIGDCHTETRYAEFAARAAAAGVSCVLALPLLVGGRSTGVISLYGKAEHDFDDDDVRCGQLFASHAAIVITAAARHSDQVALNDQLQRALGSRAAIDHAMGALMVAHRCSPAQAFEFLRDASQHRNVKLRVVAAETLAVLQVSATVGALGSIPAQPTRLPISRSSRPAAKAGEATAALESGRPADNSNAT